MKDVFKTMVEHPIATWFVIGVTTSCIMSVVTCFRKNITINIDSKTSKADAN